MPRPVRECTEVVELEEQLQKLVDNELPKAAKKWGIAWPAKLVAPVQLNLSGYRFFGAKKIRPRTANTYKEHYKQLWKFFAMIGDWESMLPLVLAKFRPFPDGKMIAMKRESLQAYLRYKKCGKSVPLSDEAGGVPMLSPLLTKNDDGEMVHAVLYCQYGWNCNKRMRQVSSAVVRLHINNGFQGNRVYQDHCDACIGAYAADAYCQGCERHVGQGEGGLHLRRVGQPTHADEYLACMDNLNDITYKERGCSPLAPWQLRELRKYWLNNSQDEDLSGLMYYTMVLISCKLFLRSDEALGIDKEDFVIDGFKIRQDGRIDAVCLRILGKTDSEWHYYRLWSDHECPDMCPVRHLLLYIYLLGWKGGKLFPGSSFLTSKKAREGKGGVFDTCIEYNSFDKAFKRSVLVALPQMETGVRKMKVGLHMFRKTAYLLAILGLGEWAAIKIDARHKCDADAKGYTGKSRVCGDCNKNKKSS